MGKKQELMAVFEQMKELISSFQDEADRIRTNTGLTEEARDRRIRELTENNTSAVQALHEKAVKILEDAQTALQDKWKAGSADRLTDAAYQAGITNALKMIEVGAVDVVGFPDLIGVYAEDANVLRAIRLIIEKTYPENLRRSFLELIPVDTRARTLEKLEQVRRDINDYLNVSALNSHNFGVRWALSSKYVYDGLKDDLSV